MRQSDISPFARDALDRLILDSFELESTMSAIAMSLAALDTRAFPKSIMLKVLVGLQGRLESARRELDIVTVQVTNSADSLLIDPVESQSSHDHPSAGSKRDAATASKDRKLSTTPGDQGRARGAAVV